MIEILMFKNDYFQLWFLYKSDLRIYSAGNLIKIYQSLQLLILEKRQFLHFYWSDNASKGTVVNHALPSLHEIMLSKENMQPILFFFHQKVNLIPF